MKVYTIREERRYTRTVHTVRVNGLFVRDFPTEAEAVEHLTTPWAQVFRGDTDKICIAGNTNQEDDMVDRKQLETLVKEMNAVNVYTWVEVDQDGRAEGVGSQSITFGGEILPVLVAAEIMRDFLHG